MPIQRFTFFMVGLLLFPLAVQAEELKGKERILYVLDRVAFGPTSGDVERIEHQGIETYLEEQLHPERLSLSKVLEQRLMQYGTLMQPLPELSRMYYMPRATDGMPPTEEEKKAARERMKIIVSDMRNNKILRAVYSPAQLQEVMTDFWFNHFNVFAEKSDPERVLISTYERDAIRPYALSRFRDLLEATSHHPAMLVYLDNWLNTDPGSRRAKGRFNGLNENYAREIMELHTLGVNGGYTQTDVTTLARIFTGWGLGIGKDKADEAVFYFDDKRHDFSDKIFLGHTIRGSGMDEGEQAMDILAAHPATAHHIAYELAQYFVSDTPPESLVKKMAQAFSKSDGDIAAILRTMFHAPEFWNSKNYRSKFKSPFRFAVSAVRASGSELDSTKPLLDRIQGMGEPLYQCLTPDGYPNTSEHWLNSDALFKRIDVARTIINGRLALNPDAAPDEPQSKAFMKEFRIPPEAIMHTLGDDFSPGAQEAFAAADSPKNKAVLVLSSPEFLYY